MRRSLAIWTVFAAAAAGTANLHAADANQEFSQSIRPVLQQNCGGCHKAGASRGPVDFLKAATARDVDRDRGVWHNVAAQLRNRTMPPVESKLTEADRLRISQWVETELRATACSAGAFAGAGALRRLNRREYHNTARELLGVDFDATAAFPADGTGGAGFDTNGETLYIPPLMLEQYVLAAQQILDRAIVTPPMLKTFSPAEIQDSSVRLPVYLEGDYDVRLSLDPKDAALKVNLRVDGADAGPFAAQRGRGFGGGGRGRGPGATVGAQAHLDRGTHVLTVAAADGPAHIAGLTIQQRTAAVPGEKRALHYRLLGMEPGEEPQQPRKAARQVLATFLPKAFRRPVEPAEVDRYMALYDRAAERNDPYEERVKLALKGVLVSKDFLFRMEDRKTKPGIYPVGQYEMASRLSYFLWSTMPDEQLFRLADAGKLQDPKVLGAQVERMLDDPRARGFVGTFTGQWLGTQEIGGRFMPLLTEIGSYYNADIASDLRTQAVLLMDRIVGENRSALELLNADYTYLTQRLVKFYRLEDEVKDVGDNDFHLVKMPDDRRAGVLGLAGVLGMTSHYEQTSPVLRGAWVLDTLLGTPVPPPPPNVPPLAAGDQVTMDLTTRQRVLRHRADPACSACHRLMDPIGFGLENFDWMGRWRDKEADGRPIDATGELPSGEKFNGPVELRETLLKHKDDFIRQLGGKVLGYALGRSLQDGDSCTIQRIVDAAAGDGYRMRTLIREVVLSLPFRNTQGGVVNAIPIEAPKVNISAFTSRNQDAKAHDNGEKLPSPPKP